MASSPAIVGPWAKEKLDALGRYLDYYTKVLKNQPWRTIYVDGFAGGGRAVVRAAPRPDTGSQIFFLPEDQVDVEQRELIDGSPRVALDVANPFARYVFIEPDTERSAELHALQDEYGERRTIKVLPTGAAEGIDWLISQRISRQTHRGVAFLDPFGARLEWATIQKLADTGLFEVFINFALGMAIQRMLPNDANFQPGWRESLDAYFGTPAWYDEVYCERSGGLFNVPGVEKRPDYLARLLELYRARLRAAFGHVSVAKLIRNTKGAPLYYLLWAGPHSKGLQGADYVLKMGEKLRA